MALVCSEMDTAHFFERSVSSVQKVLPCPFHCKARRSGVSIDSPGLENILQVPGNGADVDENHDARNGLWAILSVLNLSRAIFRP